MAYALLIDESQLPAVGEFDIDDAPSSFGRVQGVDPRFAFGELSWLRAWAAAYTQEGDWRGPVRAYAAHDGVRCLGMVALASQRLKGIRIKSLAGYYWPFRTLCASAEPGERNRFAEEMAARFARRPPASVLRFGPISSNDEGINVLLSGMRSHGWLSLYKKVGDVFVLDVPKTPESIEERVSASLHKNIQYLRRRLRKQGARLDFERHALPEAGRDVLHDLQGIERASWVSTPGGHPKFDTPAGERFYTALTHVDSGGAQPVVWILRCDGKPIAFSFHIEAGDTIYIVANSYDEEWKRFSPGSLLTYEVVVDAGARGMRRIDWGRGDSGYKSRWGATASATLSDVLMFAPGIGGRAAFRLARRAMPGWEPQGHFAAG